MMPMIGPYELNTVILGDCLEAIGPIPDNSVDSIITDPPYGLSKEPDMIEVLTHWLAGDDYEHRGGGFMGKSWDSFVPGPAIWRECYRVLKPGGCLMAFGGTRTCDLLSIAIRLAGFERFDSLCWLHGSGFAKGADISKKLDAMAGMEREVIGIREDFKKKKAAEVRRGVDNGRLYNEDFDPGRGGFCDPSQVGTITAPATEAAALWSGWRSQLKPSHEVILCFWKPREGSFANNALKWGVSGLWIDGCRIPTNGEVREREDTTNEENGAINFNTSKKIVNVSKEWRLGRFPANVLLSHHESCVRVGVKRVRGAWSANGKTKNAWWNPEAEEKQNWKYVDPDGTESVPDYRCHPDCAVLQLDRQAGVRPSSARPNLIGKHYEQNRNIYGKYNGSVPHHSNHADSGSASRFYYTPKAPPREKWFLCEICDDVFPYAERDNHAHGQPKGKRKHQIAHPTVKPIAINNFALGVLEYLCRLTKTPTGGIVLDPFGGSGTTALAAIANGRDFLIIENDPIYHRIAQKRIEQALKEPRQLELAI